MVLRTQDAVGYEIRGPLMNQAVPSLKVQAPSFPDLVGVDGRFAGGLRHYYGNKKIVDLIADVGGRFTANSLAAGNGVDWIKPVHFYLQGTTTTVDGFVVRWDADANTAALEVSLVYTLSTDTSTWLIQEIYGGSDAIGLADDIDAETWREFLYVTVAGQSPKVIYCPLAGSFQVKDMGAGVFAATLGAPTKVSSAVDAASFLVGDGVYQVAYRLYDSTRNIYSGLSERLTITLDHTQTSKATGYISLNSGGGDSGLLVDGDTFTVGTRTYEADSNSAITGDVAITITGITTIAGMCVAIADAINGDASQTDIVATAGSSTVQLEAVERGSAGNALALAVSEVTSDGDLAVSGSTLTGGGVSTTVPEEFCKATIQVPVNTAVIAGKAYADFAAMFDTVDVFRSINLGQGMMTEGAVLWLEKTVALPGNSGAWDALTIDLGSLHDNSLPFGTMYNPETDIIATPPQSGAILRYQALTFMPSEVAVNFGRNIEFSSLDHASPEYFTTFNSREGSASVGRIRRLISAGDSVFALGTNGLTHVYKAAGDRPLQIVDLHRGRGLPGTGAVHAVGNSLMLMNGGGLMLMNGNDGNMGQVSAVDRIVFKDWASYLSEVSSGYDSLMNASFFLNPTLGEMVAVYHGTQSCGRLEGTPFTWCAEGLDMACHNWRSFFVTKEGRIVSPDWDASGTGTTTGLESGLTYNGAVTSSTSTTLVMSTATFSDSMVGSYLYVTSGTYRGQKSLITARSGTELTFTTFGAALDVGTTFSISPVPTKVRFSRLRDPDQNTGGDLFRRWLVVGAGCQFMSLAGFTDNASDDVYVGVYRHGSATAETGDGASTSFAITENPSDAVGALKVDGIGVEPWLEVISAGVSFELTEFQVHVKMTSSENVSA